MTLLNEDILHLVAAAAASQDTLAVLARISTALLTTCLPFLYRNVVIKRQNQYRPFFDALSYPAVAGNPYRYYVEAFEAIVFPPPKPLDALNNLRKHLRSLVLLVPPPDNIYDSLVPANPVLTLEPYESERLSEINPTFLPLPLVRFEIKTTENDYGSFAPITRLLNPKHFRLVSAEPYSRVWRCPRSVIQASWTDLETLTMEDCLPLYPEEGDLGEGVAISFLRCGKLRSMTTIVRKWDHVGQGILETVLYELPTSTKFEDFETFSICVAGEERLAELKEFLESPAMAEMITDSEEPWRWTKWLKVELLEGEPAGPRPTWDIWRQLAMYSVHARQDDDEEDHSDEAGEEDGSDEAGKVYFHHESYREKDVEQDSDESSEEEVESDSEDGV